MAGVSPMRADRADRDYRSAAHAGSESGVAARPTGRRPRPQHMVPLQVHRYVEDTANCYGADGGFEEAGGGASVGVCPGASKPSYWETWGCGRGRYGHSVGAAANGAGRASARKPYVSLQSNDLTACLFIVPEAEPRSAFGFKRWSEHVVR